MIEGVAYLIKQVFTQDNSGVFIPGTETRREVFASIGSVTRSEWDTAGRQGLNPEIVLHMPTCNYDGEELAEYDSKRYRIYRTFTNEDNIELYLERRSGA